MNPGVSDPVQRAAVIRDFQAVAGASAPESETIWDIVMGLTPVEPSYPETPGGSLVIPGIPVGVAAATARSRATGKRASSGRPGGPAAAS